MNASSWQLDGNSARLTNAKCSATIDLAHPANGLSVRVSGEAAHSRLQVLGFTFGEREQPSASRLDAYVRGADLVATYEEAAPNHVRAQAYWRRMDAAEFCAADAGHVLIALELILSVNTSLLDSDPQVTIASVISPIADVQTVQNLSAGSSPANRITFDTIVLPTGVESNGSLVARLPGDQLSYVELLHPADYGSSTFCLEEGDGACLQSAHRLFQQRLEKGVILRARIRAALVEREHDEAVASAAYCQFAVAEPPLTV